MATPIQLTRYYPPTIIVSDQGLSRKEQITHDSTPSPFGNPQHVLERKIEHLARVLGCSEDEATHIFLHNL